MSNFAKTILLISVSCSPNKESTINFFNKELPNNELFKKAIFLTSESSLPTCTASIFGELFYLKETNTFQYCDGVKYNIIDFHGDQGTIGDVGLSGLKGTTGDTGATGINGNRGANGNTGPMGNRGATGNAGGSGSNGTIGNTGSMGFGNNHYLSETSYTNQEKCPIVGTVIKSGIDDNTNGSLESGEVDETLYYCYNNISARSAGNFALDNTGRNIITNTIVFDDTLFFFAAQKTYYNQNIISSNEFKNGSSSISGNASLVVEDKFFILSDDSMLHVISTGPIYSTNFSNFSADLNLGNVIYYNSHYYFGAANNLIKLAADNTSAIIANTNSSGDDQISNLVLFGNKLIFSAYDSSSNKKLWVFDLLDESTPAAELIGGDLDPNSNPSTFLVTDSYVYFLAKNSSNQGAIWKTDGVTVSSVYTPASDSVQARSLFKEGDFLVWSIGAAADTSNLEMYGMYIPTEAQSLLTDVTSDTVLAQHHLKQFGSALYIVVNSTTYGLEFAKISSDISINVIDFNVTGNSSPDNFTIYGDYLYFSAQNAASYYVLWRTDGTTFTKLISVKSESLMPYYKSATKKKIFSEYMGSLFYQAEIFSFGIDIVIISDSLERQHILDLYPSSSSSLPSEFIIYKNLFFFTAKIYESTYNLYYLDLGTPTIILE